MSGRKADVIKAAHLCAEAALRLVKPGNQVSDWYGGKDAWARSSRCLCRPSCLEIKACDLAWEELPSDVGNLEAAACRQLSHGWGEHRPTGAGGRGSSVGSSGFPAEPELFLVPWWLRRGALVLPLAGPFLAEDSRARTATLPKARP